MNFEKMKTITYFCIFGHENKPEVLTLDQNKNILLEILVFYYYFICQRLFIKYIFFLKHQRIFMSLLVKSI